MQKSIQMSLLATEVLQSCTEMNLMKLIVRTRKLCSCLKNSNLPFSSGGCLSPPINYDVIKVKCHYRNYKNNENVNLLVFVEIDPVELIGKSRTATVQRQ